ncbi:MAG: hypothetical protein ACLQU4_13100 [Limisphaerales bacterium]
MSSMTLQTQKSLQNPSNSSTTTVTAPTPPVKNNEPVANSGETSFATPLSVPSPSRNYFYASIGAIRAGHYTEF